MGKKKSAYAKMRDAWHSLPVRAEVTRYDMRKLAGLVGDERKKSGLGQYLSKMVFQGHATKLDKLREGGKKGGLVVYVKKSHPLPSSFTPHLKKTFPFKAVERLFKPKKEELTALEVGRAVIKAIKDLEAKVKEQKAEIRERCSELKDIVEENRRLKTLYDQAQQKIIRLNTGESLDLSSVKEAIKG